MNLFTIQSGNSVNTTGIFNGIPSYVKFCDNDSFILKEKNKTSNCEDICFKENVKLDIINNACIESCSVNGYEFEYDNICYHKCPNGTLVNGNLCLDNNCLGNMPNSSECLNNTPQGYYYDQNDDLYKQCFKSCKNCLGEGKETFNNCYECQTNYTFLNDSIYTNNCYEICDFYYFFDDNNDYQCTEKCPDSYKCLNVIKKCIKSCKEEKFYKYEYNNNCYKDCPNDTYIIEGKEGELICTPEGYYLDLNEGKYKKCYENCNICNIGGNETNHNCLTCKENYTFYNSLIKSNCYPKCQYYYYFDEYNKFQCSDNYECPKDYKLIQDKTKCIDFCKNDDTHKYEYNLKCYQVCPEETISTQNDYICKEIKIIDTTFIEKEKDIITTMELKMSSYATLVKDERDAKVEQFREIVSDFNISENKKDIIKKEDDVQYQMTTSELQRNNTNKIISSINLGDCELKLKRIYGIDTSLPLIIFKIDYFSPDTLIPIIGYEIYHPLNKSKLNLTYCADILIKLNIPVNIDESKLFKYDPNSDFYTDNCFPYTTENGTDIILNDRKQEFTNNNLSLCENNCNFTGYDSNNKQSSCDCNVKNKMDLISEIIENPNKLSNNFDSEETPSGSSNIVSIKCTKTLFSKEGLKNNISSYILIIFLTHFLLSIILFIKCGYHLLTNDINTIIQEKENMLKQRNISNQITVSRKINVKKKKKRVKKKGNNPPKKSNITPNNVVVINNNEKNNLASNSQLGTSKVINKIRKKKKKIPMNQEIKIQYNDYELNSLDYNSAIIYDKRTFCEYYLFLFKIKNIILFSFCPMKDYNSMIIRTCIFSLSFAIYYALNFVFFTDDTMHTIYEIGGKYDFVYFLPNISISFFVGYYITVILKIIFLSERNIFLIRIQPTTSLAYDMAEKTKKNFIIKYTVFFISGIIFLGFFWMWLSSFGAVYPNTQIFIFENGLISFSMALCYPFFFNIFPTILRRIALNAQEKNKEYLYKVSKYLQIL